MCVVLQISNLELELGYDLFLFSTSVIITGNLANPRLLPRCVAPRLVNFTFLDTSIRSSFDRNLVPDLQFLNPIIELSN